MRCLSYVLLHQPRASRQRPSSRHHLSLCSALLALLLIPMLAAAQQNQPPQSPPSSEPGQLSRRSLPSRVNGSLPSWLRVQGEFRERVEAFDGGGFVRDREDLYYLSRMRIGATITPGEHLSFQVQAQDARVADKTVGPGGTPFSAPFDLRMAFADIGSRAGPWAVRLGRQELALGEQRLVGHVSWLNAARTFDGARVTVRTPAVTVDAFGASVVRTLAGEFDRSGNGNRFAGVYAAAGRWIPRGSVEPYVFWRRDVDQRGETSPSGVLKQATLGVRLAGRLALRLDYGVEMALQRGSLGTDDVDAWAGHWQLRESLPGPGAVRLTGEYNYASGDANPADGVRGTFDQLYPTPHDKYGLADQIGWRNVHHVRGGVEFSPIDALPITVNYHSWWLAERRDGIYAAGGALVARVAVGAADTHVGQELDVQITRAITPELRLAAGYAHLFAGAFLREATPGASYSSPYLMVTYVFLGE